MADNIIIIGAGITGLTAAYYLEKAGCRNITILEAAGKPGGKIANLQEDGFLIEAGPDSFITTKPYLLDLIHEIGLGEEIIVPASSRFYILKNGKLTDVPKGLNFMVPTDKEAFLGSSLFSDAGKQRALEEENIPSGNLQDNQDESFGAFIERRFGVEMLKNYAAPLFAGIYSTPPYELSMRAAFPQFLAMEQKSGSITKAIHERRQKQEGIQHRSPFVSLKNGTYSLVEALVGKLKYSRFIFDCSVHKITFSDEGQYIIHSNKGRNTAHNIALTIPAPLCAGILGEVDEILREELGEFSSASTQILSLGYRKSDCDLPRATGFLVAMEENNAITASTWSSEKWEGRAPSSHHLIRCFFSRQEMAGSSKEELVKIAHSELEKLIPIRKMPTHSWLHSYPDLLPQYKTGHLQKLERLKKLLASHPGLDIAGAYFEGVGLPDCCKQGKAIAENFLAKTNIV